MTGVNRTAAALALTLSLTAQAGCDAATTPAFVADAAADAAYRCVGIGCSGPPFNTNIVGSTAVSQLPPIEGTIDGVTLLGVETGAGEWLVDIFAVEGELWGELSGGGYVNAADMAYTKFFLHVDDENPETPEYGTFILLSAELDAWGNWRYDFRDLTDWDEEPADAPPTCQGEESPITEAVIFEHIRLAPGGVIDPTGPEGGLFIACANGAMGKVALEELGWGYKPHDIGISGYQAAVRAARADYCGDGNSWTVAGTPLLLQDHFGVNTSSFSRFYNEAAWDAGGAVCIRSDNLRVVGQPGHEELEVVCEPGFTLPPQCSGKMGGWIGFPGDILTGWHSGL